MGNSSLGERDRERHRLLRRVVNKKFSLSDSLFPPEIHQLSQGNFTSDTFFSGQKLLGGHRKRKKKEDQSVGGVLVQHLY